MHFEYGGFSTPLDISSHGTPEQIDLLMRDLADYVRDTSRPVPSVVMGKKSFITAAEILVKVSKHPSEYPLTVRWKPCWDGGSVLTVIPIEAVVLGGIPFIICVISRSPDVPWKQKDWIPGGLR